MNNINTLEKHSKTDAYFASLLNSESVIKNSSCLTNYYIPSELPYREAELERFFRIYKPIVDANGSFSLNTLILGNSGIGKTALAKFFLSHFNYAISNLLDEKGIKLLVEYIDCVQHRTKSSILRHLITRLGHPIEGHGYSDFELLRVIITSLKEQHKYLFIILDEATHLTSDELFALLNCNIALGNYDIFSIIVIARTYDWKQYATEKIMSRIQEIIKLKPYTKDELTNIMLDRFHAGFRPTIEFSKDALEYLINLVHDSQNIRYGINILRDIGYELDKIHASNIDLALVQQFKMQIDPSFRSEMIDQLTDQERTVLICIYRYCEINNVRSFTFEGFYKYYAAFCANNGKKGYVMQMVRKNIRTLKKSNLVNVTYIEPTKQLSGRRILVHVSDTINIANVIKAIENLI